ncbi:TIR domain-containing protein [uncultured Tateyamaria sp.]|uniref:TIR domain-containing protein n=1 Tax=uncultured Tateyamaria sp. TaxID=455651 RepID=UPI00260C3B12|nr:TIR domain-containing protein [uncultured Tateyamaria sp.]
MVSDELFELARELEKISNKFVGSEVEATLASILAVADQVGRSWSGSWLGYHANIYYCDLTVPPPGAHFSSEWGLKELYSDMGTKGNWQEFDPERVTEHMLAEAENPDLDMIDQRRNELSEKFDAAKVTIESIMQTATSTGDDNFLTALQTELAELTGATTGKVLNYWKPSGQIMSRDSLAIGQGFRAPPHLKLKAEAVAYSHTIGALGKLAKIAKKAGSHLERVQASRQVQGRIGTNVFIGHGRSHVWRDLKDFVQDRLNLPWDEFNRVPVAGVTNQQRLTEMLDASAIAFIVMTAEDETSEGTVQARMNVIHEVGLFQGRLGFTKAIVLLEEGCTEFSNIQGLGQIRFPTGNIAAKFEDIRLVLEREGLVVER